MRIIYMHEKKDIKRRDGAQQAPRRGDFVAVPRGLMQVESVFWDETDGADDTVQEVRVVLK